MNKIAIFTDGGARGNPGPAATGVFIRLPDQPDITFGRFLGIATNNQAEYAAVTDALHWLVVNADDVNEAEVEINADSQLLVNQLNREYKIKNDSLKRSAEIVFRIIDGLDCTVAFNYIPRDQNTTADAIVNRILDLHLETTLL